MEVCLKQNNMKENNFKIGDWVYYLGKEGGGYDTGKGYWEKGVVGQISGFYSGGKGIELHNVVTKNSLLSGCSNTACAFRLATQNEIDQVEELIYEIY